MGDFEKAEQQALRLRFRLQTLAGEAPCLLRVYTTGQALEGKANTGRALERKANTGGALEGRANTGGALEGKANTVGVLANGHTGGANGHTGGVQRNAGGRKEDTGGGHAWLVCAVSERGVLGESARAVVLEEEELVAGLLDDLFDET